jgi:hypothetical protein
MNCLTEPTTTTTTTTTSTSCRSSSLSGKIDTNCEVDAQLTGSSSASSVTSSANSSTTNENDDNLKQLDTTTSTTTTENTPTIKTLLIHNDDDQDIDNNDDHITEENELLCEDDFHEQDDDYQLNLSQNNNDLLLEQQQLNKQLEMESNYNIDSNITNNSGNPSTIQQMTKNPSLITNRGNVVNKRKKKPIGGISSSLFNSSINNKLISNLNEEYLDNNSDLSEDIDKQTTAAVTISSLAAASTKNVNNNENNPDLDDLVVCGKCHIDFKLANIVEFIAHKTKCPGNVTVSGRNGAWKLKNPKYMNQIETVNNTPDSSDPSNN